MNKKLIALSASALSLALPMIALAADFVPPPQPAQVAFSLNTIVGIILGIFWLIIAAFVIISFILAGVIFITAQGDPTKIATARTAVIYGAVGILVILLSYSILLIVRTQLPGV